MGYVSDEKIIEYIQNSKIENLTRSSIARNCNVAYTRVISILERLGLTEKIKKMPVGYNVENIPVYNFLREKDNVNIKADVIMEKFNITRRQVYTIKQNIRKEQRRNKSSTKKI